MLLTTDRLLIRPYTLDDAAAAFDIYRHDSVTRWLGSVPQPVASVEDMAARLARWIAQERADRPHVGRRAVVVRETGAVTGTALVAPLAEDGQLEIGWHFNPAFHGRGYATEAARALMDAAFAAGEPTLLALVKPGNEASVAVARRLGMTPIGRTTKYYGIDLDVFQATLATEPLSEMR
jgi:RimJ/RimL family protein N-acetyltransferase